MTKKGVDDVDYNVNNKKRKTKTNEKKYKRKIANSHVHTLKIYCQYTINMSIESKKELLCSPYTNLFIFMPFLRKIFRLKFLKCKP